MNLSEWIHQLPFVWQAYFAVLSFVFGACVGSFLNVCIHRIPREESCVRPRSRCPSCGRPIAWFDNLPLISFWALRARCRHCGAGISPRYVLVELLVAILFLLVWLSLGPQGSERPLALVPVPFFLGVCIRWLVVSGLVLGTFVDLEHMIIPDRVSLGGMAAGIVLSAFFPWLHGGSRWLDGAGAAAVGAAVGAGGLWLVAQLGRLIFRKEAMGLGDVKLLGAIGAFMGWRAVFFTILVSSLAGSAVGLGLVASKRQAMQSRIPYGPYLALAALIWLFWGPALWSAYWSWLIPMP